MYRTTDFYLACWLCYLNKPFAGIEREGSRATFIFEQVAKEDILQYYNRDKVEMDPLGFVSAIRHTRELLYNLP